MFKTFRIKPLLYSILLSEGGGIIIGLLTRNSMDVYQSLGQPAFAPPAWLFPVAWSILYLLMGIAAYLVYDFGNEEKKSVLSLYGIQLAVNFLWPIIFFTCGNVSFAFLIILILLVLVAVTTILFFKQNKTAGLLMVPYFLWLVFATYLNYSYI